MTIFNVIHLFGGLAMFLYGMNLMSDKLEKLAKELNEQIKTRLVAQFRESDKSVKYTSTTQTYTVTKSERATVDTKALKAEKPDVYAAYTKKSTTYTLKANANKE